MAKWNLLKKTLLASATIVFAYTGTASAITCLAGGPWACAVPVVVGVAGAIAGHKTKPVEVAGLTAADYAELANKFDAEFPDFTGFRAALYSRSANNIWHVMRNNIDSTYATNADGEKRFEKFYTKEVEHLNAFAEWINKTLPPAKTERFSEHKLERYSQLSTVADEIYAATLEK